MKLKRPRLILRKGVALAALALPAGGCADTPEEAFRAALDDACASITACGIEEEDCATPAARSAVVADFHAELDEEGASEGCKDAIFEGYADVYSCYANLTCEEFDTGSGDCGDLLDENALERACPELDL